MTYCAKPSLYSPRSVNRAETYIGNELNSLSLPKSHVDTTRVTSASDEMLVVPLTGVGKMLTVKESLIAESDQRVPS